MLERLALALLLGGIAGWALAKREHPQDDGFDEFEAMMDSLPDYIVLAIQDHFDGAPEPELRLVPIDWEA